MLFRCRKKIDRSLFGLNHQSEDWSLIDNGDHQIETMALGPKKQTGRWSSMNGAVISSRWRVGLLAVVLVFGLLGARAAYLQIGQGEYFRQLADVNRTRIQAIPSHRGIIKDRNGLELAENSPNFRLLVWPQDIPNWPVDLALNEPEREIRIRSEVLPHVMELAQALNTPSEPMIDKLIAAQANEQLLLAEDIDYTYALAFFSRQNEYPGFSLEFIEQRKYYSSAIPTLSHVVGYTGPLSTDEYLTLNARGYRRFDSVGKYGLEAEYEDSLRGQYGVEIIEVDSMGRALRVVSRREPVDGQDLSLALDARLQAYIEIVLEERLRDQPAQRAAVVVMNPNNGEILALVSLPSFDANDFVRGISVDDYAALLNDVNSPLFPRAQAGEYPAGSTIKPVFAATALANDTITSKTTFFSSGGVMLGNRFFPDWRPGGHGLTDVYHAIADSVNTFFYLIGGGDESFPGMGLEKLMTAALSFGYGQKTGVDLPGEANGFLPTKKWKEDTKGEPWYIGDTYNVAIGQGDFLVTPLQVARATAVFANGGYLVTPHLMLANEQSKTQLLDDEIVNIVRDGMRQTVTAGSAQSLSALPVTVAGKTGTAQWSSTYDPHSWFTGFAPFEAPEVVVTVLVEQGGEDSSAIGITADILEWMFADKN